MPLTLTSLRALLVRAGGSTYAIPSGFVLRLLRVDGSALHSVGGTQTVTVDGAAVPVVRLAGTLGATKGQEASSGGRAPIVVLRAGGYDVGFGVDELVEERDVVAKSLGPRLSGASAVSGATVLPSGHLALILNVTELVLRAREKPGERLFAPREDTSSEERRVLLADDSVTTRTLERSILEAAGYTVLVAVDGADAWRILQEKGADLVVSDVEMPHMDGFALTEAIRGSPRFRALPVVLVTALESDADKARGLTAGANAYLIKSSFDQTSLLETIAQLL
jgi:two-component system chemotaxis sensor kinase CheA